MKTPRNFHGLRIGALTLFASHWYPHGRRYTLASWHNWPMGYLCWLWFVEAYRDDRERRYIGFYRIPGSQARYGISLWFFDLVFVYQAQGWYKTAAEYWASRASAS